MTLSFIDTAASNSFVDLFSRPMTPAPAPFVFINGWPGVGEAKDAVAECLALLLGSNKAVLIDVHQLQKGFQPQLNRSSTFHGSSGSSYSYSSSPSSSSSSSSSRRSSTSTSSKSSKSSNDSSSSRSSWASRARSASYKHSTPRSVMTPEHPDYDPAFRNGDRLARLLAKPANEHRIAILADFAADTPAGRATMRSYEAAALQTGRVFVPVTLLGSNDVAPGYGGGADNYGYGFDDESGIMSLSLHAANRPYDANRLCVSGSVTARDQLTMSVSPMQAHEAALTVVEFVNTLVVKRDIELASAVTTPMECREPEWRQR